MNRKLTDAQIAAAAQSLREAGQKVSGRALRAALRRQHGAVGKTERLFAVCRTLREGGSEPPVVTELRRQLLEAQQHVAAAQAERDRALARAERSEAREIAHQDRWASEIHMLREALEQLKSERARWQGG